MKNLFITSAVLLILISACTKQPDTTAKSEALSSDMVASHTSNPELLVVEATVNVSKALRKKVGKSDTMFWALTSSDGKRMAHGKMKVEALPRTITIHGRDLLQPLKKDAALELSVHIAKPGNEYKPVEKGWLVASSTKIQMNSQKKKALLVGEKIQLNLEQMNF